MKSIATVSERKSRTSPQYRKNFWDFYLTNREYLDNILFKTVHKTMAGWHVKHIEADDVISEVRDLLRTRETLEKYDPKKKTKLSSYLIGRVRYYTMHVLSREIRRMKVIRNISACKESPVVTYNDPTIDVTDLYQSIRSILSDQDIVIFNMMLLGYTGVEIAEKHEKTPPWVSQRIRGIRERVRGHLELIHA